MYPRDTEILDTNPWYEFAIPSTDSAFGELPNPHRSEHDPFQLYKQTLIMDLPYIFLFVGMQDFFPEIVAAHREMADSLNAYGAFFEYHELQGNHNSPTADAALHILLQRIQYLNSRPYKPLSTVLAQIVLEKDVESAIRAYHELKARDNDDYSFGEAELNIVGYALLRRNMLKAAIEIFKLNVEQFPEASNPYDSLGEAYMLAGKKRLAIKNYTRSLELDPGNTNAAEMLDRINNPR
jgi:tetratricopeptide (TPR) repeat protein